jgi:hypothetical protein
MAIDATVTHELRALRDELAANRREQPANSAEQVAAPPDTEPSAEQESAEDRHILEQLQDLIAIVREYIEDAEHNVAEHPALSVIGALLLGILIGRHIGKR